MRALIPPRPSTMLTTILLLGFVLWATATDLAQHKIYNWTTYMGIVTAVASSVAGSLLSGTIISEERLQSLGLIPLSECLLGFLICGLCDAFLFRDVQGRGAAM